MSKWTRNQRIQKTQELNKIGLSNDEIAKKIGVTSDTIRKYLQKNIVYIEKKDSTLLKVLWTVVGAILGGLIGYHVSMGVLDYQWSVEEKVELEEIESLTPEMIIHFRDYPRGNTSTSFKLEMTYPENSSFKNNSINNSAVIERFFIDFKIPGSLNKINQFDKKRLDHCYVHHIGTSFEGSFPDGIIRSEDVEINCFSLSPGGFVDYIFDLSFKNNSLCDRASNFAEYTLFWDYKGVTKKTNGTVDLSNLSYFKQFKETCYSFKKRPGVLVSTS